MLELRRTGNTLIPYLGLIAVISFIQPAFAKCGDKATRISQIQGSSLISPLVKETHTVEAIVIGEFQGTDALKGFFIQEETKHWDNDPSSSEGVFIYHHKTQVKVGQVVRLKGEVQERYGQTQLSNVDHVEFCKKGLNQNLHPLGIDLPFTSDQWLEAFEGMLVRIQGDLTVTDNAKLGKYGEFVVANKSRLFAPSQVVQPGKDANMHARLNGLNQLIIDDGSLQKYPSKLIYPAPGLSAVNTLRIGQKPRPIVGVLAFAFSRYRVHPTAPVVFKGHGVENHGLEKHGLEKQNKRPQPPKHKNTKRIRIAAFNVDNYFNGNGQGGGFPTLRGADNYSEFKRQGIKLGRAISGLGAHIVGIAEVENDGYGTDSSIASLAAITNTYTQQDYHYIVASKAKLGSDAIAVGIMYQISAVTPIGNPLTTSAPPFNELGRQPLAQTFIVRGSKFQFTVVMNHFKSKSCRGAKGENQDQGDGQGCFNPLRIQQAEALTKWLVTVAPSSEVIILGDLNSYAQEDPIKVLLKAGYHFGSEGQKLFENQSISKAHKYYSYVYQGQAGMLDYVLYHKTLKPYFKTLNYWHINTDEPRALDYNTEHKSSGQLRHLFNDGPYRSSDHDPVYLDLEF